MQRKPGLLLLLLTALTLPLTSHSEPLQPFRAEYKALFDLGLAIDGEATRSLEQNADGSWRLRLHAEAMIAMIDESSHFRLEQEQVQPLLYRYQRKVLRKKRTRQIEFDWDTGLIRTDATATPLSLPANVPAYDKVSHHIPLWRDAMAGNAPLEYRVVDGDHLETYRYRIIGEQQLSTPAGSFDTLLVERDRGPDASRQTRIWLAKEVPYLVVKLEQVEEGKHYEIQLSKLH
ncbi:DUF3108 domain-containing protein [Motiliproteus sediminis]|uniref:DUF3108 domain-containing protein n=1 Tax=Motiliproteus sediminis TaxID=1468178 RepID=UPI001AEF3B7B|nr:DUF3108 domain-containing protein [Motiliproteus sediminis]